mgnify:CR=1 FL=1
MKKDNEHIKSYLSKIISNKYFVAKKNPKLIDKLKNFNKSRYYEAEVSSNSKYLKKELTYGLKFGSTKSSWVMISFCLLISIKMFYDFSNNSDWNLSGMMIVLGFFLFCILYFGYLIIFEHPIIEIQENKLIYRKKEHIRWENIVSVGVAINKSGKPPYDKRIIIGTKQGQIKELKVTILDSSIQNVIDVILKNVA